MGDGYARQSNDVFPKNALDFAGDAITVINLLLKFRRMTRVASGHPNMEL